MPTSSNAPYPFVYLASQSPRRQELLQQLGVRFELLLPRPDEDAEALEAEWPGERAHDYVMRVCALKARADLMLRLSSLTLPHAMVRVLLAEQLYRAWTITQNHPYHRA